MFKLDQQVKRIGEILLENGSVDQEHLDAAIKKQRIDRIRNCPAFSTLTQTELSAVANKFNEVTVQIRQQSIIQDEPDPALYIIAVGKVEVYRIDLE